MHHRLLPFLLVLSGCMGRIDGPPGGTAAEAAGCEPATFSLSRLNRRELDAAFATLLGDESAPARLFVAETISPGSFDNAATELSIAPQLVLDLEGAATRLIDDAWARDAALTGGGSTPGAAQRQAGSAAQATVGAARDADWNLWSNGEARFTFNVAAGPHRLTLDLYGDQAGNEPARVDVWLNNAFLRTDAVPGTQQAHTTVEFESNLAAGVLTIGLRFPNDLNDSGLDRNLLISSVTVTPLSAQPVTTTTGVARVRVCTPTTDERGCARDIVHQFARRAWRRAPGGDELAGLLELYDATRADGDDFTTATKLALRAVVLSPHFLMRSEAVMGEKGPRAPEAVAARLSFFLWGAPPDAQLDALVDEGRLLEAGVLDAQVERMLADPRAAALRTHLVEQWFDARDVQGFSLDPGLFAGVNPAVMRGVQRQFDAWVEELFFGDHDALDALDAPVTFVDAALANFLGLPAPAGDGVERRVLLAGDVRAGLFGQSAPLIVTSNSTETNPPRRGRWVMERLLCQPVPLPVGIAVPPVPPASADLPTARDRLEALTSPAACAGCHSMLNPIGFGLENFGADSRWRTVDHGAPIDTSGSFRGQALSNPTELAAILKKDPGLPACMVQKTLSFALGQSPSALDQASVASLSEQFEGSGRRYRELVRAVALSPLMKDGCRLK